jgi:hypothetical protein
MVKIDDETKQRIKTAFHAYAQGQPKVSEGMVDQLICAAIPGLTYEQLQELKKVKGGADGYSESQFFALVCSRQEFVNLCVAHFPPAPHEEKPPEIDTLALKTEKGF